jgi:signal transduction histidine kinase
MLREPNGPEPRPGWHRRATQRPSWWQRQTLSRRIAIAMVLSLVAVQFQAFLQIRLLSYPELRFTGTRWLADVAVDAASRTFALAPQERARSAQGDADKTIVTMHWSMAAPALTTEKETAVIGQRLHATLKAKLGAAYPNVHVAASRLAHHWPSRDFELRVVPATVAASFGQQPLRDDEPDVLIPAAVSIAIQGADGSWLMVRAIGTEDAAIGTTLPFVPVLIGGLIIACVSTATARRIMAPLDGLVAAANQIGTAREFVPVPQAGLAEFSAVASAFEEMQRRLLRFVDDRTQMLAAISHDLRSSLTRLRLAVDTSALRAPHHEIEREIADMQAMLDQTLAFATGEARMVPNQPVDLASLLISLTDETSDFGAACTYAGPDHAEITGHPVALKRAFRNLIDNAIKYGKAARISLAEKGGRLSIIVEDDGPGIPLDRVDDAFTPFRRLDAARTGPGAGLGLTIARDVVQAHGGTISMRTSGSTAFAVIVEVPGRLSVLG